MGVAVVAFVDKHYRGLGPLREGVGTDVLATRHVVHVAASAKKGGEVVVEPATAVPAGIDYDSLGVAVLAEQTVIDRAEARTIHALHVNIGDAAVGY